MSVENNQNLANLFKSMRSRGWLGFFGKLGKDTLLLTEPSILDELNKKIKQLNCATAEGIDDCNPEADTPIRKIIVFKRQSEMALVKRLKRQFPDKIVYSAQYDMAPNSNTPPPFKLQKRRETISAKASDRVVILSETGSDSEFLNQVLEMNSLGKPISCPNDLVTNLLDYTTEFSPLRFLDQLERYNAADPNAFISVSNSLLRKVLSETNLRQKRLKSLIARTETKFIYFLRRDKLAQTVQGYLLAANNTPSMWDENIKKKSPFSATDKVPNRAAYKLLAQNLENEVIIENFLNQQPLVKMIVLEDLLANPDAVIKGLCSFLDISSPKNLKIPDYSKPYDDNPILLTRITEFKREVVDRLGLHVNDAGSLITETEKLLTKKNSAKK